MNFKKSKTVLLASILTAASLYSFAIADPIQNNTVIEGMDSKLAASVDSGTEENTKSFSIDSASNIAKVDEIPLVNLASEKNQTAEQTAIEKNLKTEKDRKHFWQVLWLRGGAKKTKQQPPQPSKLSGWIDGNYATGDWGGLRTKLEDHGVNISTYYLSDTFNKFQGGLEDKNSARIFGYVETNLAVDTKKLGLWSGGKFDVRYGNKHGHGVSRDSLGEYLGINGYDYRELNQIEEYYYEQSLFSDRLKIKVGKQDASFDICALSSGLNFIGNSFVYVPNMPLPLYPEPALGALVTVQPLSWLSVKSGFYDGGARGGTSGFDTTFSGNKSTFFVEELGVKHNIKNHPGNYFAGYWLHSGHKNELTDAIDARTYAQNYGMYLGGEQFIYKENKDNVDDTQGLTMLGQFGWAPADRNNLEQYYGAGLQYKGLIPKRDNDIVGIGTSIGKFSGNLKDMASDGRKGTESIIEMFYKLQLTKWLALVPDLQVVMHPNGQQKGSFLMGIRFNITL